MSLTRRGERAVIGAALIAAVIGGMTAQHWHPIARAADGCRTIELPEDTEGTGETEARASALIAAGWFGNPTDGAERLYSPECPR